MVDKIWSDWQNRYPENFWSFQGGSLQAISNVSEALEYPNGGPPWLNVGHLHIFLNTAKSFSSWIPPSLLTVFTKSTLSTTWWISRVKRCATFTNDRGPGGVLSSEQCLNFRNIFCHISFLSRRQLNNSQSVVKIFNNFEQKLDPLCDSLKSLGS